MCDSKRVCSLRIIVSLVSRSRYLSVFISFGSSGEEPWRSLGGRSIASFGGSPTVADHPKSMGALWNQKYWVQVFTTTEKNEFFIV